MKQQLDSAQKNNQRSAKDLAILYKRLILTVDRTVGPLLRSIQFTRPTAAKQLTSINNVALDAGQKFNELCSRVSSQGNVSNIPGLS